MNGLFRIAVAFFVAIAVCSTSPRATAAEPATPRDPAADSAKIDELTKLLLSDDYKVRLKACSELSIVPAGSKAQEELLLDKALPVCAADTEWRMRSEAARTIGSRYSLTNPRPKPADPRAVALCVKLAGDPNAKVRYNAVYFGLSTLEDKSDEVIASLVKATMATPPQGENDITGRVASGLDGVPADQLLPHIEPYLKNYAKEPRAAQLAYTLFVKATKTEPPGAENMEGGGPMIVEIRVRGPNAGDAKAAMDLIRKHVPVALVPIIVIQPFNTESAAYALARDIKTRHTVVENLKAVEHVKVSSEVVPATPQVVARLMAMSKGPPLKTPNQQRQQAPSPLAPGEDIRHALLKGDSKKREAIFGYSGNPGSMIDLTTDEAGIDVLEACAADPSPAVRRTVAMLISGLVWNRDPQHPRGIAMAIKLSADADASVRYNATYYGLSTVKSPMSDEVIRALVATGLAQEPFDDINLHGRIAWGLRDEKPERLTPFFDAALKDSDFNRATTAYATFVQATAHEPPGAERFASVANFVMWFGQSRDSKYDTPEKLLAAFRDYAPVDKLPEVAVFQNGNFAQGAAVTKDLAVLREIAAKMNGDPEFYVEPRPNVLLPARLASLRGQIAKDPAHTISTIKIPAMSYEEVLRDLHAHLGQQYPSFAIKGIDWKKVGDELLPLAKDVKTDAEFGLLCTRLVARLEDSHAQVLPGTSQVPAFEFPHFDPGFACLIDDRDRPVVYHVDKGSPAESGGVTVGMAVLSVNGKPAEDAMKQWMDNQRNYAGYSSDRYLRYDAAKGFCRQVKLNEELKLELEDAAGMKNALTMPAAMDIRYLPRLPVPIDGINDSGSVEATNLGDGIGYIYVRRIKPDLAQGLDAALTKLGEIKGLIIDVRGNSGGGFDLNETVRSFNPNDTEQPERPRYAGPIAMLIDERCISAGEGWSSWFVATKRAKLFGTTTAGASSRKETYTLTNGLFKVVVPVKAYAGSLARPLERRGLEPDVAVRCNAKDLAAGKDTVLEAAKQFLTTAKP